MTPATFRALRELIGMSQADVADALEISERTVKRWERDGQDNPPADFAARWLTEQVESFLDKVYDAPDLALEIMLDPARSVFALTYFKDQEQYDRYGHDPGKVERVNAVTRAMALELMLDGNEVELRYPDEGAIITPGSRY